MSLRVKEKCEDSTPARHYYHLLRKTVVLPLNSLLESCDLDKHFRNNRVTFMIIIRSDFFFMGWGGGVSKGNFC